jgi:peptide deformylase
MALLHILHEPDPRLRRPSIAVERVDAAIVQHLNDMLETMYAADGIGLAAPQVNLPHRLVVMDVGTGPLKLVNPVILWKSSDQCVSQEGCLSVPDYYSRVRRPDGVRIGYWDQDGASIEREFTGLDATCIQHEIDHLDGILFIDHLSVLEQSMVRKKLQKRALRGYAR